MVRFISKGDIAEKTHRRLEVIAAGLPRCATSSLQAALESSYLGFSPTMHMAYVMPYTDRIQLVVDALREEDREHRQKILHKIFDGYGATADFPGNMFVDDLMDMYPEAKIILNQRTSGKDWVKSISDSLGFFGSKTYLTICFLVKADRLHYQVQQEAKRIFGERFGVDFNVTPPFTPEMYATHNQFVRDEARKRGMNILEWQAEEGWKPIAAFLGKQEPDVPFPRMNDQRTMMIVKTLIIARGLLAWSALAGLLYAGAWFWRRWL